MTSTTPLTTDGYRSSGPEFSVRDRYTSAEFARLEAQKLWTRVWQLACRFEEVEHPGDFYEYRIADQSILIVRLPGGQLKAFHNACQHRGMLLKEGRGTCSELRCGGHAWCWNLDGTLKEVVDPQDFDPGAIAPEALRLPECLVDTWAGLVFVNMDLGAEPLYEFLGPVRARVEYYAVDKMVCTRKRSTVIAANWKLGHEGFIETYHAVGTHPQTLRYIDDTEMIYEQSGNHGMHRIKSGGMGRPSARLGEGVVDRREVLLAMSADLAEMDYYDQADAAQAQALVDTVLALPDDVTMGSFFASVRRQQAEAEGLDLQSYSDDDLLAGELWNLFPNFTIPCNGGGNASIIQFRPNGLDPESSLLDVYYLKLVGDDSRPEMVHEFYADWRECERWGSVLRQDFTNFPLWQRGVHSQGFRGPLWGRPDGNVANLHRAISDYLAR